MNLIDPEKYLVLESQEESMFLALDATYSTVHKLTVMIPGLESASCKYYDREWLKADFSELVTLYTYAADPDQRQTLNVRESTNVKFSFNVRSPEADVLTFSGVRGPYLDESFKATFLKGEVNRWIKSAYKLISIGDKPSTDSRFMFS